MEVINSNSKGNPSLNLYFVNSFFISKNIQLIASIIFPSKGAYTSLTQQKLLFKGTPTIKYRKRFVLKKCIPFFSQLTCKKSIAYRSYHKSIVNYHVYRNYDDLNIRYQSCKHYKSRPNRNQDTTGLYQDSLSLLPLLDYVWQELS